MQRPKYFYTVGGSEQCNPRSQRILRQLKAMLVAEEGVEVVVAATAEECVAYAAEGVAVFDGWPHNCFSPLVPARSFKAPAWAKASPWGVVIGSKAERSTGCARALAGMFFHPRRPDLALPHPWGADKSEDARQRRRARRRDRTPSRGWHHVNMTY